MTGADGLKCDGKIFKALIGDKCFIVLNQMMHSLVLKYVFKIIESIAFLVALVTTLFVNETILEHTPRWTKNMLTVSVALGLFSSYV